jgi:hypothetical protein
MKKLLAGEKFSVGWFFGWLAGSNIFSPFFILSLVHIEFTYVNVEFTLVKNVATFFHHFLFCHSPVPVHATAVSFNNGWSLEILNQTSIQ